MVNKTKRLLFVSALVFSILTAGAYGAKLTYAQDSTVQNTLVERIASKFGLKTADVQAVFDQQRKEHLAQFEVRYEQMLTDAVTKGDLTKDKKQLILAKHKEIESTRASLEADASMTPAARRSAFQKAKVDLQVWAKNNDVDLKYLVGGRGMMRMHWDKGQK